MAVPGGKSESAGAGPGAELEDKIKAQGDTVRKLKTEKADKASIDAAVKTLLELKSQYKAATGSDWKPPAAPGASDNKAKEKKAAVKRQRDKALAARAAEKASARV